MEAINMLICNRMVRYVIIKWNTCIHFMYECVCRTHAESRYEIMGAVSARCEFFSMNNACSWLFNVLLCGRPVGRTARLVRPSVRPSVSYGRVTEKQKRRKKIGIDVNVSRGKSKWAANFHLKRSKVKVTGRQNQNPSVCCLSHTRT